MMTMNRWQQVKELFHSALEREPASRSGFLAEACAGDDALRREVESLIASHESKDSFLDAPAYEVAASLFEEAEPLVGHVMGHYRITELLGRGGMGEIYLAEDTKLERLVALKLLPAEWTGDASRLTRFQREARAASALNHPNILTIYEIGEVAGTNFIATEFIEGETLRQQIKNGLKLSHALDIATQVASALAAAHEAGIVHRDVKPENVMIRRDGYVKVLDFGLAKLVERPGEIHSEGATRVLNNTQPGIVMGTVQYMSPEQARGLPVDARTDIWSLGVVLYEMVAGCAPFEGPTITDVLAAIIDREPVPPSHVSDKAPAELDWIIRKALSKDRDERYQTARELLGDLRRLKEELEFEAKLEHSVAPDKRAVEAVTNGSRQSIRPVLENPALATRAVPAAVSTATSFEAPLRQPGKRKKTLLWASAAFISLLILIGASVGAYKFLWRAQTVSHFNKIQVTQLTTSRNLIHAALSPDGKYIAYVVSDREQHSLWIRQATAANDTLVVPPAAVGFWGVTFSRDGADLYYVTRAAETKASLYRVPALGGTPQKILTDIDSPVTFSPDGKRMAFVRGAFPTPEESALIVVDVQSKAEQTLAVRRRPSRFYPANFTGPSWSPDGQFIASAVATPDPLVGYQLIVFRVSDGTEQRLTSQQFTQMGRVEWLKDMSGLVAVASDQFAPDFPSQIWHVAYPEGEARRITNDLNNYRALSLTADSTRLVTVTIKDFSNLWIAPEGNSVRAKSVSTVTARGGVAWTPDGRVVFATETGGTWDIWIMNQDGSGRRQLTQGAGHNVDPAVSPDGKWIAFVSTRSGKVDVWRMGLDGSNPTPNDRERFHLQPHVFF